MIAPKPSPAQMHLSTSADDCLLQDHSAAPKDADPALSHIHFSQLYLASLYTYDSQTYHADVRVVYPYTPPADVEEAIATGMPIL